MSPPRRPRPPDNPTSVRLTSDILKRVDRLLPKLERDPERRALGKITRSKAIRLAIVRGLDALEGELAR